MVQTSSAVSESSFFGRALLLVGTGGAKRRPVLAKLRSLGLARIVCLNEERNWADAYVDDWICADAAHPTGETFARVDDYLERHPEFRPHGVMTYDEYSVVLAAHLAARLGKVGIPPSVAETAKNKGAFRRFCRERGLPAPEVCVVSLVPTPDTSAAESLRFPVVVKPVEGAGSVFVRKVMDTRELRETAREYADGVARSGVARLWRDPSLLVEEYLDGDEVDVDMLIQGGVVKYLAVTDNFKPLEPYFLEVGGEIPSALPDEAQKALADMAVAVTTALGVTNSCVHFEAKLTTAGPVPIEVNLRIGGAEVYAFNRGAWGVDLVEGAARIALGIPIVGVVTERPREHLASCAFNPPHSGTIRAIDVDESVERSPNFAELVLFKSAGDRIDVPPRGYEYAGWMAARGGTGAEARANVATLARGVHLDVERDAPGAV